MPRTGVSYDDVVESIHILEKAGLNASIRNIRERIGKGSLTTIAEHKREYEIANADTPREALPDAIAKGLMKGAEAYWQELVEAAEAEIHAVRDGAEASRLDAERRLESTEAALSEARESVSDSSLRIDQLQSELATANEQRVALEGQLSEQQAENQGLATRVADLEAQLAKSDDERVAVLERLNEASGNSERLSERLENNATRHAAEQAALSKELAEIGERLARRDVALEDARRNATAANEALAEMGREKASLQKALSHAEAAAAAAQQSCEQLTRDVTKAETALLRVEDASRSLVDEKDAHIADLQAANKGLQKALVAPSRKPKKAEKVTKDA